ncbi:hypothetical protein J3459_012414 [Metarhizium acridum]|uniref:uncharacterized protein n=1 Tax=Metarhizium acridum TaxID=92637 RepID=UPI001C6B4F0E|nr:hypothetical protein J3458_021303 [Metarhizium acridum]KAG8417321.1 hypothetical protein J3459_012414 [Metarhizium acridum]
MFPEEMAYSGLIRAHPSKQTLVQDKSYYPNNSAVTTENCTKFAYYISIGNFSPTDGQVARRSERVVIAPKCYWDHNCHAIEGHKRRCTMAPRAPIVLNESRLKKK